MRAWPLAPRACSKTYDAARAKIYRDSALRAMQWAEARFPAARAKRSRFR